MPGISVSKLIPEFTAEATSNRSINSSELRGRNVVLYFYPRDNTPGCTTESQDFRDHLEDFRALNTEVIGVSRDSLASHEKFRDKHNFGFDLIADPDEHLCKLFDVIREKNMYGRKVMGVERSTFLIDAEGVLRREWRKVKVPGHVDEVLEAARELKG